MGVWHCRRRRNYYIWLKLEISTHILWTVKCVETSLWHQRKYPKYFFSRVIFVLGEDTTCMHMCVDRRGERNENGEWRNVCEFVHFFFIVASVDHRTTEENQFFSLSLSSPRHSTRVARFEGSVDLQLTLSKSSLGINVSMLSLNFFQGFTFKFVLNEQSHTQP